MRLTVNLITLLTASVLFFSCKKESEQYTDTGEKISDYLPLQVGKYITYRLDSLVFPNSGRAVETHYYEEKNVIDAIIPDATGRPSYRIFRYLRDTTGTQPWTPSSTYYITPFIDSITPVYSHIDVIDNNLRVVKLAKYVKQDVSWKGNNYLPNDPYINFYGSNFTPDDELQLWNFNITDIGATVNIRGKQYSNVITVEAANSYAKAPVADPKSYAESKVSIDKYSKGIGLIYQEYSLWEHQAINESNITDYYNGFGVIRRIIDHN